MRNEAPTPERRRGGTGEEPVVWAMGGFAGMTEEETQEMGDRNR
jgi:hypothetical protein